MYLPFSHYFAQVFLFYNLFKSCYSTCSTRALNLLVVLVSSGRLILLLFLNVLPNTIHGNCLKCLCDYLPALMPGLQLHTRNSNMTPLRIIWWPRAPKDGRINGCSATGHISMLTAWRPTQNRNRKMAIKRNLL